MITELMRAIVLIDWGPRRWQKALIAPGERLVVGRQERAGLVVPHDMTMSGLHFELAWDGAQCTLRDLGSLTGTFVNGERIEMATLDEGEWIQAGATIFSVYVEGRVPPWSPAHRSERVTPEHRRVALAALRAGGTPLYAVLDAAAEARILTLLRAAPDRAQSLYDGAEGEDLEDVAPYLVALSRDGWLLERLVGEGWGARWGIYLTCPRPFAEVRRQLRRNLIVTLKETEEQLYFRFYDPTILTSAARALGARQRQELFGEIEAFLVEGTDSGVVKLSPGG